MKSPTRRTGGRRIPSRDNSWRGRPMKRRIVPYGIIDSPAAFGLLIRQRRKEDGLTQAEAAALCNVGTRFLSELERGKATAELGKAFRVMRGLGLNLTVTPRGSIAP